MYKRQVTVYGGADIREQINKLKGGAQIIVGTPGRIIDLIERHVIKLSELRICLLYTSTQANAGAGFGQYGPGKRKRNYN